MEISELYKLYQQYPSIQTDTRKLKRGDIFFALKGPNFNANLFAEHALKNGAEYAIVDEEPEQPGDRIIKVADTLKTLQDLAGYHRMQFENTNAEKKDPLHSHHWKQR